MMVKIIFMDYFLLQIIMINPLCCPEGLFTGEFLVPGENLAEILFVYIFILVRFAVNLSTLGKFWVY